MSGADMTELARRPRGAPPWPFGQGRLPPWACVSALRQAHIHRVVALMSKWAERLELPEADRQRWRAAGRFHDALRDAPADDLRQLLSGDDAQLPAPLLHGPAAAVRLRGLVDDEIVHAVRFHTTGHPDFEKLGEALYMADFLEPGRKPGDFVRRGMRRRAPTQWDDILADILDMRVAHQWKCKRPPSSLTAAFRGRVAEAGE